MTLAEAEAKATPAEIVAAAIVDIAGGPVALVAEEPELRDLILINPGRTVNESAEAALHALGERLIVGFRLRSHTDSREGLLRHLDEQAQMLTAMTATALADAFDALIAARDQIFVMREALATLGVPHSTVANETWRRLAGAHGPPS